MNKMENKPLFRNQLQQGPKVSKEIIIGIK